MINDIERKVAWRVEHHFPRAHRQSARERVGAGQNKGAFAGFSEGIAAGYVCDLQRGRGAACQNRNFLCAQRP